MAKIIAFHASQGGTGKTNIVANIAAMLALRGKRVGVVDVDLQTPALHVLLGMKGLPPRTLNDFLLRHCAIEEAAYDVGAWMGPGGDVPPERLYLVPAGIQSCEITTGIRRRYDTTYLDEGLLNLGQKLALDYVLTDTHAGVSDEGLLVMAISDLLLLTMTTDQKDLQGTAALLDLARELDGAPLLLVVNMVLPTLNREHLRQQLLEAYGCPVAALLPLSEGLAALGSSGLFTLRAPDDPFSRGIGELVDLIEGSLGRAAGG